MCEIRKKRRESRKKDAKVAKNGAKDSGNPATEKPEAKTDKFQADDLNSGKIDFYKTKPLFIQLIIIFTFLCKILSKLPTILNT